MGHSSIWRCDRCGAKSEPQPGSAVPEGWQELGVAVPDSSEDPFVADLCPVCVTALQAWLVDVT